MGITGSYIYPSNLPVVKGKLSYDVINYLWDIIEKAKIKNDLHNNKLAGNIDASYALVDENNYLFDNGLGRLVNDYYNDFLDSTKGNNITNNPFAEDSIQIRSLVLKDLWVNFQKEHEFNPIHEHAGVFSFVIWLKIPFTYKEQNQISIAKNSNSPKVSLFEFSYMDILGNQMSHEIPLGREDEGTICVFPASLRHVVYPFFNCKEERVSISGNIYFSVNDPVGTDRNEQEEIKEGVFDCQNAVELTGELPDIDIETMNFQSTGGISAK